MPVLQALETLDKWQEENESEEVDDVEDELSWCQNEPELNALSDSDTEIAVSDSESKGKMHLLKRF